MKSNKIKIKHSIVLRHNFTPEMVEEVKGRKIQKSNTQRMNHNINKKRKLM